MRSGDSRRKSQEGLDKEGRKHCVLLGAHIIRSDEGSADEHEPSEEGGHGRRGPAVAMTGAGTHYLDRGPTRVEQNSAHLHRTLAHLRDSSPMEALTTAGRPGRWDSEARSESVGSPTSEIYDLALSPQLMSPM